MRLIDSDELDKVKYHPLPYTHITPSDVDAESYMRGWNDAIDAIMIEAPTIEERKTGMWERHYSRPNVYADMCWHCSNCGYKTPDNWANKWKFCPNCGARMVQEGEGNEREEKE